MSPEDFANQDAPLGLWPENLLPFTVFLSCSTQWRMGFGGPTGLDYTVLPTVLRLRGIPRADWPDLFDDLRTLEAEALAVMHADKPADKKDA